MHQYRLVDVAAVQPYPNNARTHSEAQISQIAASMREFGVTNPVLVDEHNGLIAGHARVQAARQLGLHVLPAIVVAGLSDAQKRALVLADNKLALNAGWDEDLLRTELEALESENFDLSLIGFSEAEIAQLTAPGGPLDPAAEWQGMPEFEQADKTAWQTVTVHFKDQGAVEAFAALIGQTITRKTRFTWYPQVAEEVYIDKRYVADDAKISDLHSLKGAF